MPGSRGSRPVPLAAFLVSAAAFLSAFLGGVVALRAVSRVGIIIAIGAAHRHVGVIGASGMSIHSFLDGLALAAGLAVGGGLGVVIAVVVVIHRFSDGISVVSLLLASHTSVREAYRWVAIVAIAPVLGVLLGLVVTVPDQILGLLLAVFAGFFLYVGAAELLPEAHRSDRSRWVVLATIGGVVAIYFFSLWAGAIG